MNKKIAEIINKVTSILKNGLSPKRIILFGSYSRGDYQNSSDLDILLIMPNGTNRRKTAVEAYKLLGALGISKDIVVVTEEDVEKYGELPGTVLEPALAEGKVLYDKAA